MAKGQQNTSETWHYTWPVPSAPLASRGGHFDHAIETTRARLDMLQWRATKAPEGSEEILPKALEELRTALEELQVADEELRQQNEDLVRARRTAESERRRYQELFDGAPYGYVLTDALAVIQEANRAAATLLALPQEKLSGKPLVLFVAQDERRAFLAQLRRAAELERVQDWEIRLQPRGRLPMYAALTVTTVHGPEGRVVALRWLLRDISVRVVRS